MGQYNDKYTTNFDKNGKVYMVRVGFEAGTEVL